MLQKGRAVNSGHFLLHTVERSLIIDGAIMALKDIKLRSHFSCLIDYFLCFLIHLLIFTFAHTSLSWHCQYLPLVLWDIFKTVVLKPLSSKFTISSSSWIFVNLCFHLNGSYFFLALSFYFELWIFEFYNTVFWKSISLPYGLLYFYFYFFLIVIRCSV